MVDDTVDTGAAPPASSATPASTTSVSSGTASEAMLRAVAASSAEASPDGSKVAGAAPVTGATVQTGADGKPVDTKGPIPFDRHEQILKNARETSAQEALKPFAWAKGLSEKEATAAIQLVSLIKKDPAAFWRELGATIGQTPAEAKATVAEAFPEADLEGPNGVKAYSDVALKKTLDLFRKQLMAEFQGELRPLMEFRDGEVSTRERAALAANMKSLAGRALTQARALPHFKEHEPAIVEKLQQMDPAIRAEVGPIAAMYMAFEQVKAEKVYPTLQADAEKRVRADFDKKAAASGIHPVGGDGKTQESPVINGEAGLAAHMRKLAESNDPRLTAGRV